MTPRRFDRPARAAVFLAFSLAVLFAAGRAPSAQTPAAATGSLPARLTDAEFWKLVGDVSEPGGYFRITDNYTSNEARSGGSRR